MFGVSCDVPGEVRALARDEEKIAVRDGAGEQRSLLGWLTVAVVHLLFTFFLSLCLPDSNDAGGNYHRRSGLQ